MKDLDEFSIVGVDVGGTSICVGLIVSGRVVEYYEAPTESWRMAEEILHTTIDLIKMAVKSNTIGIGIGVPGLVDVNEGVIYNINNIPAWRNFPLKNEMQKKFDVPVFINNDANCFALGEYFFGKEGGCESLVAITLGTGLGAGIVVNGKLHTGILGCAGEIGGMPYEDADYETYCSSKFFQRFCRTTGEELYNRASNGDQTALDQFNMFGTHLGKLLKIVLFTLAPNKMVLGGSISKGHIYFANALRNELNTFPYKPILERSAVAFSSLENSALLGSAALVLNER